MTERKQSCCQSRVRGCGWCWLFIGLKSWIVNGGFRMDVQFYKALLFVDPFFKFHSLLAACYAWHSFYFSLQYIQFFSTFCNDDERNRTNYLCYINAISLFSLILFCTSTLLLAFISCHQTHWYYVVFFIVSLLKQQPIECIIAFHTVLTFLHKWL